MIRLKVICGLLIVLVVTPGILSQSTKPVFKIEAPNILCSNGSGSPSIFTINLIPGNVNQKLKYNIKISYEYSIPTRTQHHSLSLWRTIRTLEQQMNAQRTSIDAENKINIATANLTPGVIYMFDIEGEDETGIKSDVQRFVLDYKDGNLYRMCQQEGTADSQGVTTTVSTTTGSNPISSTVSDVEVINTPVNIASTVRTTTTVMTTVPPAPIETPRPNDLSNEVNSSDVTENLKEEVSSIKLSGPSKISPSVPLTVKADITFTGYVNEYYVRWNITNIPTNFKNILAYKGHVLVIPPYTLTPNTYTITAYLMDASNSKSVATSNHTFDIEKQELKVSIIPVTALIGVGRSIDIELKIQDFNINKGRFDIQWRCVVIEEGSEAESLCDRFNDVSEPKKSIVFTKPGKYHMLAMVTNELNLTAEVISTIDVQSEIVAKIAINSVPQMPVDVTNWIKGDASISYVVPKCVAKWVFVNEEGYAYENVSVLGLGIGELIVNDFEANFLKELNDYTNSTVTKHIKLHIPPANTYPKWNGLQPDSRYKLRVITDCPAPIDLDQTPNKPNTKRIQSFLDVDLETNSPPVTSPIEVTPNEGFALITPFTFKTTPASDKDGPLLYYFGIIVDQITVVLDSGYEMYEYQTFLPYSKTPIKTFCEVCDKYKACRTQSGPSINVNMSSELAFDFTRSQLDAIESGFDRGEYNSSLNNIFILGLTLKHVSDERIYKEFHQNIIQMLKAITKRILSTYEDKSVYLSEQDIFDYVQNVKRILETFDIRDREIIQTLLSLLEKVTGKGQAINERDIKRRRRRKRQTETNTENPVVDLAIGLISFLPPDVNRTIEELRWFCRYPEYTDEKNMTEYHTIKYNKTYDFRGVTYRVPRVGLDWTANIILNDMYDVDPEIEYCVGSAFDKSLPYPMYQLYVFNSNDTKNFHYIPSKIQKNVTVEISIHLNDTIKPDNTGCEMLVNDSWDENVCKVNRSVAKTLICMCTRNDPFRIKFVKSVDVVDTLTPASVTQSMTMVVTATTQTTSTKTKEQVTSTLAPLTSENESSSSTLATVGYSALGLLGLGGLFGTISFFLYRNSKKKPKTFGLDLQAIAAEARTKAPGVTYARFHDEHMMQGDNIYSTQN